MVRIRVLSSSHPETAADVGSKAKGSQVFEVRAVYEGICFLWSWLEMESKAGDMNWTLKLIPHEISNLVALDREDLGACLTQSFTLFSDLGSAMDQYI